MTDTDLTGADSLTQTLASLEVDHCFANPGTSEMHLVQALEKSVRIRPVLCLFEGVCTGAADGFGRASGRPAATLMHLGAGLANGIANLHNARRADTPLVNLVGDHSQSHRPLDSPLTSDIEGLAKTFSCWMRTSKSSDTLAHDGAEAVRATRIRKPGSVGRISTLIIPADCAWGKGNSAHDIGHLPDEAPISASRVQRIAKILDAKTLLLLGNSALTESGLRAAGRICKASGCRVATVTLPSVVPLSPALPYLSRLPYFPEQIESFLKGVRHLVLVGAEPPVSFFAYRGQSSELTPTDAFTYKLAATHENAAAMLEALADDLHATDELNQERERPEPPEGNLSAATIAQSLAAILPENAIISTDSGGGGAAFGPVQKAVPALWMNITGGAIGQGGPAATGAALACPNRRVVALLGDGGALYTHQCLWTQARESLGVTTVIYNNASYKILVTEYERLGINEPGPKAEALFDLGRPDINWVELASSMGVPGIKARDAESFHLALKKSFATPGPMLIDATLF